MFPVISSLTRNLFEICLPFHVLFDFEWTESEGNCLLNFLWLFYRILPYIDLHSKNPLRYTVHILTNHKRQLYILQLLELNCLTGCNMTISFAISLLTSDSCCDWWCCRLLGFCFQLDSLYYLGDWIRVLTWTGHVAHMGKKRTAYRVLVVKPEGKRPLWIPRRRREHSIKVGLKKIGWEWRDWIIWLGTGTSGGCMWTG